MVTPKPTTSSHHQAFNGLGKSIANHKKKGDKLIVTGEIRHTRSTGRADLLQHRDRR
jgi:single-stranded DNA-binding protein